MKNTAVRKNYKEGILFLIKIMVGLFIISPILVGVLYSFVPANLLHGVPDWGKIFSTLTLNNYKWIFTNIPVFRFLFNSLIICTIVIVMQVIIASLAAYSFAFYDYRGKSLLFMIVLITMMVPPEVTVIANFLQIQNWGLINTYAGLSITSLISGTAIFMMRQFYLQIPKEMKEASMIDGCKDLRFLFKIVVPLSVPITTSLAIYLFISVYNQYFWPMLIAQRTEMQTIQIGMSMLVGIETPEYGRVLAGSVLCILFPVIVFIIGQDFLVKGLTAGAVKG